MNVTLATTQGDGWGPTHHCCRRRRCHRRRHWRRCSLASSAGALLR